MRLCVAFFVYGTVFFMTYDSVRCGFDICILHYANYFNDICILHYANYLKCESPCLLPLQGANVCSLARNQNPGRRCALPWAVRCNWAFSPPSWGLMRCRCNLGRCNWAFSPPSLGISSYVCAERVVLTRMHTKISALQSCRFAKSECTNLCLYV